jgi:hypothetical protein
LLHVLVQEIVSSCTGATRNAYGDRSGAPGDIIAVMAIAVELAVDIFCHVPPHDEAEKWNANLHYRCMQFRCSTALRKKPCIYLVLRGGHFKALASATTAPKPSHAYNVMELFKEDTDPATAAYVTTSYSCSMCG